MSPAQAVNPFAVDAYFSFTPLAANPVPINQNQASAMFISPGFAALQAKQPQMVISQSPNPMLLSKVNSPPDSAKNGENAEIAIVDQSRVSRNPISRNTNEFAKPQLELKLSDDE